MKITRRASRRATLATASIGALALLIGTAGSAQAATAVGLGTADSFAILAGTGVTNTGPTTVTGDLGTHPTGTIPGAGSITLNGATHAADAVADQAKTDLVTAYNTAAGALPVTAVPVDLGGSTLTPGVYASGGVLGLTGTLTLDGLGDPNAVFILQSTATLITATDSAVRLIGDAQACNVFWLVPSSATLGVRTEFVGTVIALTSIAMQTNATIEGRVLARNGAVTLDTNTITRPVCAAPTDTGTPTSEVAPNAVTAPVAAAQVGVAPTGGVSTGDGSTSAGSDTTPYLLGGGLAVAVLAVVALGAMTAATVRVPKRKV